MSGSRYKRGVSVRRTVIIGGAAVVLVGALGTFAAWTLFGSDAPVTASLSEALRQAPPAPPPIALSVPVAEPALNLISGSGSVQLDGAGRYQVVAGPSFVGYRVKEVLAGLGSNVAVGRSSEVAASFAFDGRNLSNLDVSVNLQALKSDDTRRDAQLRTQAIESDRFPSARFVFAGPTNIGGVPAEGDEAHVILIGDLTLHGVTRPVTAHIYGARKGELTVVVGHTEVLFSDFGIKTPQSIVVASVDDRATVEFQLIFKKA